MRSKCCGQIGIGAHLIHGDLEVAQDLGHCRLNADPRDLRAEQREGVQPVQQVIGAIWGQVRQRMQVDEDHPCLVCAHGVQQGDFDGGEKYIAYAPIKSTNWSIGVVMPVDEIVMPAKKTKEKIISRRNDTEKDI